MNAFQAHAWPGNVRELRNTLERAVIVCDGALVEPKHLPPGFGQVVPRAPVQEANAVRLGVGTTVDEAERLLILKTLEATNNNKTRAAEILGISLKTLHNKLKEYGQHTAATNGEATPRPASPLLSLESGRTRVSRGREPPFECETNSSRAAAARSSHAFFTFDLSGWPPFH